MDARKLVKMANEIASFFEAEPDTAARAEGFAGHLKRFWDPRMRRALYHHIDADAGAGLKESALHACQSHRDKLLPPPAA